MEQSKQSIHPTNRINKISSTLSNTNASRQLLTLQSNDQLLSTRHSHRKYKLSYSQLDKIDKLSQSGLNRWKYKKQNQNKPNHQRLFTTQTIESDHNQYPKDNHLNNINQGASIHSINYHIKKDQIIELNKNISLRVQIISFDLPSSKNNSKSQKSIIKQFSQLQQNIDVICFQIHNQQINTHFRSQFTYQTLNQQIKFVFDTLDQLYTYVTDQTNQRTQHIVFDYQKMYLKISVKLRQQRFDSQKVIKSKQRWLNILLLPFAVIQIIEHHNNQQDEQKNQLQRNIKELNNQIQSQKSIIYALRMQNDKIKQKLNDQQKQVQKQKAQKQILLENYEKISKASQVPKQFFFEFVPDQKSKNYLNFTIKNNVVKKIKNDLKWDQLSSEAPLPKAGRHYFTFIIKTFTPDFMFGIVTLKAKDTLNAFLGYETICLYVNKSNTFIYDRGSHYKLSVGVKLNDMVIVVVDRQKNMIEWLKKVARSQVIKKGQQNTHDKQGLIDPKSCIKIGTSGCKQQLHTQRATICDGVQKHRKCSQSIIAIHEQLCDKQQSGNKQEYKLDNRMINIPGLDLNEQIQYIHSTEIAQQMLSHELYGYGQIYNINQALILNERK